MTVQNYAGRSTADHAWSGRACWSGSRVLEQSCACDGHVAIERPEQSTSDMAAGTVRQAPGRGQITIRRGPTTESTGMIS